MRKRWSPQKRRRAGARLLQLLGVLCILYCLGIWLFMGYGTRFFLIWALGGACLIGFGWLLRREELLQRLPGWLKATTLGFIMAMVTVFAVVEIRILVHFGAEAAPGADYCLILGAQMKSHGPSDVLRRRLDAAIWYLEENPDTIAIVSGGQGVNEPVSEAAGMYEYLTAYGIDSARILLEDQSSDTMENMRFSSALIDKSEDSVVLVTNNFHVFRAVSIARKAGYQKLDALAADAYPYMIPNNLLREFFGVIKDTLAGNM